MLKVILTQEEHADLDEGTKVHYKTGDDGKFYLEADGVDNHPSVRALRVTLDKFKTLGSKPEQVERKLNAMQAALDAFEGLDPDEVKTKLSHLDEIEAGGGGDATAVAERIRLAKESVREALTKAHGTEKESLETENRRLQTVIEKMVIDQALDAALGELDKNGQPIVIPGLKSGAKAILKERKPRVIWDEDTPIGVFENDGGEEVPASTYVGAWLRSDESQSYRTPSGNEGSESGGRRPRSGTVNPWKEETWNLTEQGRIHKENPGLAKQLASAAGKSIAD